MRWTWCVDGNFYPHRPKLTCIRFKAYSQCFMTWFSLRCSMRLLNFLDNCSPFSSSSPKIILLWFRSSSTAAFFYRSFNDNSWRFDQIFISISLLQGQACRRRSICRCCMVKIPKGNTSRNCLPATMSWKEVSSGTPYYLILLYKDSKIMAMLSGSVWYLILQHFTLHELNMYSWHV